MASRLIKKNGESIVLNKSLIAIITLLLLLLSSCATAVAYSVGIKATADNSLNIANENKENIENNQNKINNNREDIAVINAQYEEIIRRLKNIEENMK